MLPENQNNYRETLERLKQKIKQARLRVVLSVNVQMLAIYWEIGKTIADQEKIEGWGRKTIETLAKDLKAEFEEMKGFSPRNLRYMRDFAVAYPFFPILQVPLAKLENVENQADTILQSTLAKLEGAENQIVQAPLAQLTWYHHLTLLDKVKDPEERLFYIHETVKNGWSRDVMVHQIEGGLYRRQGKITSNFKRSIPSDQSELVQQIFKDPYKFDFIYLGKEAKERDLEDALTNQITKVLLELGQWFAFMGRQFKVTLGENEYYYDLLFYHTRLKRYIVIDLKINEFIAEYKGKMEFYLTLADEQLRSDGDEPSIGLILCKTKGGLVAEYALRDSTKPIGIAEYKINEALPEEIKGEMPSIEELEAKMEKEYEELKSPGQKRFELLKERLEKIKIGDEIKQTATPEALFEIIDKSLIPLYQALIKQMDDFNDWFNSNTYSFKGKGNEIIDINQLAENWKNEEFLKSNNDFYFSYRLLGLKRGSTEGFDIGFQLNFRKDIYRYELSLINDREPIIKKLYHEQLAPNEIETVVEAVYNKIMDEIDSRLEYLNR